MNLFGKTPLNNSEEWILAEAKRIEKKQSFERLKEFTHRRQLTAKEIQKRPLELIGVTDLTGPLCDESVPNQLKTICQEWPYGTVIKVTIEVLKIGDDGLKDMEI